MAAIPASAKQIVTDFLNQYGLGSLTNWAWGIYKQSGGGSTGIAAITNELPNTPEFKARFPAYQQLAKEGRAMSIQQMLDYETTTRQIFHAAGIPQGFYDQPDDFAKFMLANVSTSELEARVQLEQQAAYAVAPDVRAQLKALYGIDEGHMVAAFLDPNAAEPLLQKRLTAAQIGAQAQRTQVGALTQGQAENLVELGVTDQAAAQGFQQLGLERGLFQAQVQGESQIGLATQLAAQFGGDTTAQLEFQRRAAQRKAQFQGGTGFQVTQQGVGGLAPSERTA